MEKEKLCPKDNCKIQFAGEKEEEIIDIANKKMNIIKIEKILDQVNADYGSKEEYCIFCKSKEHNSQVGILHQKDCIVQNLRDEIKNTKKVCKWLHADWCHDPKDEHQEKCPFYFENYLCPSFEEKK